MGCHTWSYYRTKLKKKPFNFVQHCLSVIKSTTKNIEIYEKALIEKDKIYKSHGEEYINELLNEQKILLENVSKYRFEKKHKPNCCKKLIKYFFINDFYKKYTKKYHYVLIIGNTIHLPNDNWCVNYRIEGYPKVVIKSYKAAIRYHETCRQRFINKDIKHFNDLGFTTNNKLNKRDKKELFNFFKKGGVLRFG